jgi:ribosomal protein S27E
MIIEDANSPDIISCKWCGYDRPLLAPVGGKDQAQSILWLSD